MYIFIGELSQCLWLYLISCAMCFPTTFVCAVSQRPCSVLPRVQVTVVIDSKCMACLDDRVVSLSRIARKVGFVGWSSNPSRDRSEAPILWIFLRFICKYLMIWWFCTCIVLFHEVFFFHFCTLWYPPNISNIFKFDECSILFGLSLMFVI